MEKRIIVTARVRKDWAAVRIKDKKPLKDVVVVLGDPSRNDSFKPSGVFDDDDFYTIDKMKSALKELEHKEGYRFKFLNNHDTLIQDLVRLRKKKKLDLVFNLCDEGYLNDARKELHVPALLEILGVPYTGAGPQCLAFCYDKSLVRGIANEIGVSVPDAFLSNQKILLLSFLLIFHYSQTEFWRFEF